MGWTRFSEEIVPGYFSILIDGYRSGVLAPRRKFTRATKGVIGILTDFVRHGFRDKYKDFLK